MPQTDCRTFDFAEDPGGDAAAAVDLEAVLLYISLMPKCQLSTLDGEGNVSFFFVVYSFFAFTLSLGGGQGKVKECSRKQFFIT